MTHGRPLIAANSWLVCSDATPHLMNRRPRIERREGYTLLVDGPVPPGAAAITLGSVIIIRERCCDDEALLAHELVHVRQWAELGVLRFVTLYLGAYVAWRLRGYDHWSAYRRIPLECEAEWCSVRRHADSNLL